LRLAAGWRNLIVPVLEPFSAGGRALSAGAAAADAPGVAAAAGRVGALTSPVPTTSPNGRPPVKIQITSTTTAPSAAPAIRWISQPCDLPLPCIHDGVCQRAGPRSRGYPSSSLGGLSLPPGPWPLPFPWPLPRVGSGVGA